MRSPTYHRADGTLAQMDTATGLIHLVDEHDNDTGQTAEPTEDEAVIIAAQQQAAIEVEAARQARTAREQARAEALGKAETALTSDIPEVRDLAEAVTALLDP